MIERNIFDHIRPSSGLTPDTVVANESELRAIPFVVPDHARVIPPETVRRKIDAFECDGFVEIPPTIRELRATSFFDEPIRTNTFSYIANETKAHKTDAKIEDHHRIGVATEGAALEMLIEFLESVDANRTLDREQRDLARDLLDHLAFIGETELLEATEVFALDWQEYLEADPANQICVIAQMSNQETKSDTFVFETVLSFFTEQELVKYRGRIVTDVEKITSQPDHVRIILIDDWTITRSSLEAEYKKVGPKIPDTHKSSVEIHLIAADPDLIEKGFKFYEDKYANYDPDAANPYGDPDQVIPVKAYFKVRKPTKKNILVTGTHSAADMSFETPIADMLHALNQKHFYDPDETIYMPPLTNIVRPYRNLQAQRAESLESI